MDGFNVVMVIAIILFARLGVRLVMGYIKMKEEQKEEEQKADDKTFQKDSSKPTNGK